MLLVVPTLQLILEAVGKTYLAQVFYTDQAAVGITKMWAKDRADAPAVRTT